ncbi:hypothetical protein [Paenibacillus odorifer]|uniref:Uncharacterized protein n=1 Tax=Paenibacillus odorifer TaxID=189426 RepID=A0A1R0WSI5_9BACL|nr:hypothetical protein [Paenibacillus odorifer]OMD20353.1 hypothetical protein BJP51_09730 [Paenibacillus odorifer]OMD57871.1 hypothetical protein BSK48_30800 [Paenibacillus odorifer]
MSIFVATIFNKGKRIAFASESRTCTLVDNLAYIVNDDAVKLHKYENIWFYCSGVLSMAEEVVLKIKSQPVNKLSPELIVEFLKTTYEKNISNIKKSLGKYAKHALQLAIPFCNEGIWEIHYYDIDFGDKDFMPYIFKSSDEKPYVFAVGKGGNIVQNYIEHAYSTQNEYDLIDIYTEAFELAADEMRGGNMTFHFDSAELMIDKTIPIKDKRKMRMWKDIDKDLIHGIGDGVVVSPSGKNLSGTGRISKPNGALDLVYLNNNYAHQRRLLLKDEGVELSTQSGDLIIGHDGGSFIKLKANGDIDIKSVGKITMNGTEYNFN